MIHKEKCEKSDWYCGEVSKNTLAQTTLIFIKALLESFPVSLSSVHVYVLTSYGKTARQ